MSCRFCPRAGVESAATDYIGVALPPSSVALLHSRVAADSCYSVTSGTLVEIGAAAT